MDHLLEGLNEQQIEAVRFVNGICRVVAGAGSGKTKTLTHRFAYLMEHEHVPGRDILCVTFTNKAAKEMRERIKKLTNGAIPDDFVCTFHSFGVKVLRAEHAALGIKRDFKILDSDDQLSLMKELYRKKEIDAKTSPSHKMVLGRVEALKKGKAWKLFVAWMLGVGPRPTVELFQPENFLAMEYIKMQAESGALDFTDLITFTAYLFDTRPDVREKWAARFRYIMVDETQDNSDLQWLLIRHLQSVHHNLFIVGDPDQAIYGFRGAVPESFVRFDSAYKGCRTFLLTRNYRSTPTILNASNNLIACNRSRVAKELVSDMENPGDLIDWNHADDSEKEAEYVAGRILSLLNKGVSPTEIAVLYRISSLSRQIEQACIRKGIKYQVYGGLRFFERKEIKDCLSYLRLVEGADNLAFLRVINEPKRQLADAFVKEVNRLSEADGTDLYTTMANHLGKSKQLSKPGAKEFVRIIQKYRDKVGSVPISEILKGILDETKYMETMEDNEEGERKDNILELLDSIQTYEEENGTDGVASLTDYLQDIALYTNIDNRDVPDSVKIMTIHQSKGLEFEHVFVIGFQENIMPSFLALQSGSPSELEEERRLAYVAMTRAKKGLVLTSSAYTRRSETTPSRFLPEIGYRYINLIGDVDHFTLMEAENLAAREVRHNYRRPKGILSVGDKMRFDNYGVGIVSGFTPDKRCYLVDFFFEEGIQEIPVSCLGIEYVVPQDTDEAELLEPGDTVYVQRYGECQVIRNDSRQEMLRLSAEDGYEFDCPWEMIAV